MRALRATVQRTALALSARGRICAAGPAPSRPVRGARAMARAVSVQASRLPPTETSPRVAPTSLTADGSLPKWEIRMLYDGGCPLCMREVDMLRQRDAGVGRIDFVDIDQEGYDPALNAGITFEQAMGSIHAITREGEVVTGMPVFRRLYEVVGLGWVYAVTRLPWVERAASAVYDVWARNRLAVTGRPPMEQILAAKQSCRDGACDLPGPGQTRRE